MGLSLNFKRGNGKLSISKTEVEDVLSKDDIKRLFSTIELKPLTKEEISKSRINAYQPVY